MYKSRHTIRNQWNWYLESMSRKTVFPMRSYLIWLNIYYTRLARGKEF